MTMMMRVVMMRTMNVNGDNDVDNYDDDKNDDDSVIMLLLRLQ